MQKFTALYCTWLVRDLSNGTHIQSPRYGYANSWITGAVYGAYPQGSILDPLPFVTYIWPTANIAANAIYWSTSVHWQFTNSRDGGVQIPENKPSTPRCQGRTYMFQPIALETFAPISESAEQFLNDFGHKITSVSADDEEGQ